MAEIPKIVRERLKAASSGSVHPDADVLTAYSERSLPERERSSVLDHLSRCAECREIVALALPATEAVQALPRPSKSWLAWPAFRWGFASAGLAVVALFAFIQYRRSHEPTMALKTAAPAIEAKTEPMVSPAEDKALSQEKAKLAAAQPQSGKRDEMFVSAAKDAAPTANRLDSRKQLVISRNTLAHGPLQSNQWQQQNAFALAKQAPANEAWTPNSSPSISGGAAAPAPAPIVVDQPQSPAIDATAQDSNLVVNNQSLSELPAQGGQAESDVEKAKPAIIGPASKTVVDSDRLAMQLHATRAVAGNTPRWTINSNGGLQRSYDQGVTWQDVNVNKPALAAGAAVQLYAATERAKVANAPAATKPATAKKDQSSPVFRTVVANGPDVWVGGANGVLYHSIDAGANWTRVLPSSADAALTGDILTMEFPDPLNGKVVTSTSETWTTTDGGLTWRKQ